jgi:hypothetical protein
VIVWGSNTYHARGSDSASGCDALTALASGIGQTSESCNQILLPSHYLQRLDAGAKDMSRYDPEGWNRRTPPYDAL